MNYQVQWDYRSGLGGPWKKGDLVELDPRVAEAVNRDSPGVLVPVEPPSTAGDRMVRKGSTRTAQ